MGNSTTKILRTFNILHQRTGFDKEDITIVEYLEGEAEFNEQGLITKETHLLEDGQIDAITINKYDERGHLIVSAQYDGEKILCQKTTNTYDNEDHVICQSNMYGEESPEYNTIFEYQNGLLLRQVSCDDDESCIEKEYSYDNQGRCIKEIDYTDEGEIQYIIENQYNDQGLLSQVIRQEILNKDRRSYQYGYDEHGNKIKDLIYNYNDELIAKVYYTYDETGKLLDIEAEDLDKYQKTIYQYEGDLVTKISFIDKEGNVQTWTEYQYDEQKEIASITRHIHDEIDESNFRILSEIRYERE